jgi:hypothetical protein
MLNDLLIWAALLVALCFLVVDNRSRVGALTLAYFLALSLGHVPGLLAYLDPNTMVGDDEATRIGFDATLKGMTAFIAGAMAARILFQRTVKAQNQQMVNHDIFSRLGWRVLTIGIASYFVLLPVSALLPSLTAISSALGTLLILGLWLQLYAAANANDSRRKLLIIAMLPLLPLGTLATGGFIGFGTVWALSTVSFLFAISRRRIVFYLAAPFAIFLGLSLFVTYWQQRDDIRDVVWNEGTSMFERLNKISGLITNFQFLDLSNERHLIALDGRLNQNDMLGTGIIRHQAGEVELLYGSNFPLWALIPRAIWPDKPAVGGGQDLVTQFTGIRFEEGTSVGAGQVLEFYANFGISGVIAGFAGIGFILMRLDQLVMRGLAMRDIRITIRFALPGLALIQPMGNLLEIVVAVASAIITAQALVHFKVHGPSSSQRSNPNMSGRTKPVIVRR